MNKIVMSLIISSFMALINENNGNNILPGVAAELKHKCQQIARVYKIEGSAFLSRPQGESEQLKNDQILCNGDKINIEAGTKVTIICKVNNQFQTLPISAAPRQWGVANICPPILICDINDCTR